MASVGGIGRIARALPVCEAGDAARESKGCMEAIARRLNNVA